MAMRLSPGVVVTPILSATIDRNGDGVISAAEEAAYTERLLRDVSLVQMTMFWNSTSLPRPSRVFKTCVTAWVKCNLSSLRTSHMDAPEITRSILKTNIRAR